MDERFVKAKQLRNFCYLAAGLCAVCAVVMLLCGNREKHQLQSSMYYTKKISTGVDGLSDRELWVEKSTNEIADIRAANKRIEDENKLLQKRLDSIQKMVIGIGAHLNAFDGRHEDEREASIYENTSQSHADKQYSPITESSKALPIVNQGTLSIEQLESFSEQSGVQSMSNMELNNRVAVEKTPTSRIQVIQFHHENNEYDLSENFIFAGTYARAVLIGSVVASAGIGSSANPEPVLLRITDSGNLPNHLKGFLKDAVVIGAAYGDLSSESVVIRLERLVKIDATRGVGVDIAVKGYVASENGCSKIRGKVFDRAGPIVRSSAVAGFLSGVADYLSVNNNSAFKFEPNSGLAQFSPQAGSKMLQQGASKGISNAVEKYADFIIKRAEQLQPVIMIDGGRNLTIVFTESVKASAVHLRKVRNALSRQN